MKQLSFNKVNRAYVITKLLRYLGELPTDSYAICLQFYIVYHVVVSMIICVLMNP